MYSELKPKINIPEHMKGKLAYWKFRPQHTRYKIKYKPFIYKKSIT